MATLDVNAQLTLLSVMNREGTSGNTYTIGELLSQTNEFINDWVWTEGNGTAGHEFGQRIALPAGSWRKMNDGVAKESSQVRPVSEAFGLLEAHSEVDKALVGKARDPQTFRFNEDLGFVQGLGNTIASTFIYGNPATEPGQWKGLAPRLDSIETNRVINSGGTGSDLSSAFIVEWGINAAFMAYPFGSGSAGLGMEDMGTHRVEGQTSGTHFYAMVTRFMSEGCLCVKDPARNIFRVANIESSGTTNTLDDDDLLTLLNRTSGLGSPVIYVNRTIRTQLDILAKDKTNAYYTADDVFGRPTLFFRGVPVRTMESILDTETALT
jgi:hypothetical protein